MSFSYTVTDTTTFTQTHAKHIAAKVATDLKRVQRLYGKPPDDMIVAYEAEVIEFLKAGLLDEVTYGFQRNDYWIEPTLTYTARDLAGVSANDDDPGRIRPGADISGAFFQSYLTYDDSEWNRLTPTQQEEFNQRLPFQRTEGSEPGVNGSWSQDLTYSAGDRALDRASLRS